MVSFFGTTTALRTHSLCRLQSRLRASKVAIVRGDYGMSKPWSCPDCTFLHEFPSNSCAMCAWPNCSQSRADIANIVQVRMSTGKSSERTGYSEAGTLKGVTGGASAVGSVLPVPEERASSLVETPSESPSKPVDSGSSVQSKKRSSGLIEAPSESPSPRVPKSDTHRKLFKEKPKEADIRLLFAAQPKEESPEKGVVAAPVGVTTPDHDEKSSHGVAEQNEGNDTVQADDDERKMPATEVLESMRLFAKQISAGQVFYVPIVMTAEEWADLPNGVHFINDLDGDDPNRILVEVDGDVDCVPLFIIRAMCESA